MAIYYPETIDSNAIYNTETETTTSNAATGTVKSGTTNTSTGNSQNNTTQPTTTYPAKIIPPILPQIPIANDTIGDSINTRTTQILGTFTFGQVGALQVGNYTNGTSGDIRITPSGITARNASGTNTFAIDGTTGNAEFYGTIKAGSVVVGYVASEGGTYTTTSATAAKVMLLPDANTGIVAYGQDGTTVVFKVWVAGTDVGDVQIGNYTGGNGALWDNSAGTFTIKGNLTAGNITGVAISGTTITGGSISGTTITGTTITGSKFSTGTSGNRVEMNTNEDIVVWYNSSNQIAMQMGLDGSTIGKLYTTQSGRDLVLYSGTGTVKFNNNNLGGLGNITTSGTISAGTFSGGTLSGSHTGTASFTSLSMNGNNITSVNRVVFNTTTSNTTTLGALWIHNTGGGNYKIRAYLNSNQQCVTEGF